MNNKNINSLIHNHVKVIKDYTFKNNYLNNNKKNLFKNPIGLFDPYGENVNPLTDLPYENLYSGETIVYKDGPLQGVSVPKTYKNLAYNWSQLKVYEYLNPILKSVYKNQITIIRAGTGVGKTVITPKIALQAFNFKKKIICTVPKQLIAADNALYSAKCLDVKLGEEVGFFYMGKNQTSENTKLTFTTPGSLKSKITGSDPYLSEYACVIIDEIHERSVQTDQLLLLIKEVLIKRPDFRLILMSATIDLTIFKEYFTVKSKFSYNEIDIPGTSFDVQIHYEKKQLKEWKAEAVSKIINILKTTSNGDILVFIKSAGDGNQIKDEVYKKAKELPGVNPFCTVLEAKTSTTDKEYATEEFKYKTHPDMDPDNPYNRKIVMATNVAESSLTVDGIIYVIDNGFSFESSFYPKENASSLMEERISQAAANQRKGRAGRTQPGICYRLYTEEEFNKFKKFPTPDIQKTDITSDILDVFSLNYIKNTLDVRKFLQNLISPPSDDFIISSLNKLEVLGAVNNISNSGIVTDLGRAITQFRAIEPNFAKSILASYYYYCKYEVINIVLISIQIDGRIDNLFEKYYPKDKRLSEKEIKKEKEEYLRNQKRFHSSYGDYFTLLNVYNELKEYMKSGIDTDARYWCKQNGISPRTFVSRNKKGNWDLIGEKARKINDILMKIVRPAELRKKYYNAYKNDGGKENIALINNEIKKQKNMIIDTDQDILDSDLEISSNILQSAGYVAKPYEINLFPNAMNSQSKDKNILTSLVIGNICNLAVLIDPKKNIYKTCFPTVKMQAKFDQNSTLTIKNRTKIVLYNELFTTHKDQKVLKLNLVTKIPNDIILKVKKEYKEYLKPCFETHEVVKTDDKHKKDSKSKKDDKSKKIKLKSKIKFKKTKFFKKK